MLVSTNTRTTDLVTWPVKRKVFVPMEYALMCGLFNKVSDLLKVRHTLDCIAADTDFLNIYLHIYVLCINSDMLTAKWKIEFTKVLQSLCTYAPQKNQNINFAHLCTHLVENFASILNLKIVFNKLFLLKLSILKK